jgi:acetylglutamate/LysW-gamma-L-alpha-aminoadipate kinase
VEKINTGLLTLLLDHGYMPVLCPPGMSYDSEMMNVDGDRAAAALAAACKAETLVILSNVPGLLRDVNDANSLVRRIDRAHMSSYMDLALGRMKHKMMGAAAALEQGVGTVIVGDARLEHPIQQALQGQGTVIR